MGERGAEEQLVFDEPFDKGPSVLVKWTKYMILVITYGGAVYGYP